MREAPYTIDYVENLANLILPKLQAVGEGNGSYVHRANELTLIIKTWLCAAKEKGGVFEIVVCREYIRTAEEWLISIAHTGGAA